jgi:trans-aconitate methyltransferase
MSTDYSVWKGRDLVRTFVEEIRGGVPYAADQIDVMLRVITAAGRPVERFADLGCGSGVLARALLERYPAAQATLVDMSEPMLEAARGALGDRRPAPFIALADLAEPDWRRALDGRSPFDVVVSGYAIHHLPHIRKRALYTEILELLSPGGLFINVEHVASATPWVESVSDELIIDSVHRFHTGRGGTKTREQVRDEFVRRPDKAANILALVEDQCTWLRAIGFRDVDCFFKAFELAVFGGRRA